MLRNLFDLGRQRTVGQAIGFYLFYAVLGTVLIVGAIATMDPVGDQSGEVPLTITRPSEGSQTVSNDRISVTAFANGTTIITSADGTREIGKIVTSADGSMKVTSRGANSVVTQSGRGTSLVVNDLRVSVSEDGVISISTTSAGDNGLDMVMAALLSGFVAALLSSLFVAVLSLLVLLKKRCFGHVDALILAAAGTLTALVGGIPLGLIFVSILTTRPAGPSPILAPAVSRSDSSPVVLGD